MEKKLDLNSREDIISDNYTKNKIEMEIVLSSSEFFKNISIVRFPYIFSYDDYTNRFQSLCELAIRKKASNKKNKFKFSIISKDSAAEALMSILAEKPLGIVDPCNPGCANIDEILKKIKNLNYN